MSARIDDQLRQKLLARNLSLNQGEDFDQNNDYSTPNNSQIINNSNSIKSMKTSGSRQRSITPGNRRAGNVTPGNSANLRPGNNDTPITDRIDSQLREKLILRSESAQRGERGDSDAGDINSDVAAMVQQQRVSARSRSRSKSRSPNRSGHKGNAPFPPSSSKPRRLNGAPSPARGPNSNTRRLSSTTPTKQLPDPVHLSTSVSGKSTPGMIDDQLREKLLQRQHQLSNDKSGCDISSASKVNYTGPIGTTQQQLQQPQHPVNTVLSSNRNARSNKSAEMLANAASAATSSKNHAKQKLAAASATGISAFTLTPNNAVIVTHNDARTDGKEISFNSFTNNGDDGFGDFGDFGDFGNVAVVDNSVPPSPPIRGTLTSAVTSPHANMINSSNNTNKSPNKANKASSRLSYDSAWDTNAISSPLRSIESHSAYHNSTPNSQRYKNTGRNSQNTNVSTKSHTSRNSFTSRQSQKQPSPLISTTTEDGLVHCPKPLYVSPRDKIIPESYVHAFEEVMSPAHAAQRSSNSVHSLNQDGTGAFLVGGNTNNAGGSQSLKDGRVPGLFLKSSSSSFDVVSPSARTRYTSPNYSNLFQLTENQKITALLPAAQNEDDDDDEEGDEDNDEEVVDEEEDDDNEDDEESQASSSISGLTNPTYTDPNNSNTPSKSSAVQHARSNLIMGVNTKDVDDPHNVNTNVLDITPKMGTISTLVNGNAVCNNSTDDEEDLFAMITAGNTATIHNNNDTSTTTWGHQNTNTVESLLMQEHSDNVDISFSAFNTSPAADTNIVANIGGGIKSNNGNANKPTMSPSWNVEKSFNFFPSSPSKKSRAEDAAAAAANDALGFGSGFNHVNAPLFGAEQKQNVGDTVLPFSATTARRDSSLSSISRCKHTTAIPTEGLGDGSIRSNQAQSCASVTSLHSRRSTSSKKSRHSLHSEHSKHSTAQKRTTATTTNSDDNNRDNHYVNENGITEVPSSPLRSELFSQKHHLPSPAKKTQRHGVVDDSIDALAVSNFSPSWNVAESNQIPIIDTDAVDDSENDDDNINSKLEEEDLFGHSSLFMGSKTSLATRKQFGDHKRDSRGVAVPEMSSETPRSDSPISPQRSNGSRTDTSSSPRPRMHPQPSRTSSHHATTAAVSPPENNIVMSSASSSSLKSSATGSSAATPRSRRAILAKAASIRGRQAVASTAAASKKQPLHSTTGIFGPAESSGTVLSAESRSTGATTTTAATSTTAYTNKSQNSNGGSDAIAANLRRRRRPRTGGVSSTINATSLTPSLSPPSRNSKEQLSDADNNSTAVTKLQPPLTPHTPTRSTAVSGLSYDGDAFLSSALMPQTPTTISPSQKRNVLPRSTNATAVTDTISPRKVSNHNNIKPQRPKSPMSPSTALRNAKDIPILHSENAAVATAVSGSSGERQDIHHKSTRRRRAVAAEQFKKTRSQRSSPRSSSSPSSSDHHRQQSSAKKKMHLSQPQSSPPHKKSSYNMKNVTDDNSTAASSNSSTRNNIIIRGTLGNPPPSRNDQDGIDGDLAPIIPSPFPDDGFNRSTHASSKQAQSRAALLERRKKAMTSYSTGRKLGRLTFGRKSSASTASMGNDHDGIGNGTSMKFGGSKFNDLLEVE